MKKRCKILPLLGILALSSCGYGPEIKDKDQIKELEQAISDKMYQVNSGEIKVKYHYSLHWDGMDEEDYDVETLYRFDLRDGRKQNHYYSILYKSAQHIEKTLLYVVDDKDDQAIWYSEFFFDDNEPVYDFERFENIYSPYKVPRYASPGLALVQGSFFLPSNTDILYNLDFSNSAFKYHSKGEGNLTIEINEAGASGGLDETFYFRRTYNDYVLESVEKESVVSSSKGTEVTKIEGTFKVEPSSPIALPSDWQDNISKQNSSSQWAI